MPRILVVDDDEAMREVIKDNLSLTYDVVETGGFVNCGPGVPVFRCGAGETEPLLQAASARTAPATRAGAR